MLFNLAAQTVSPFFHEKQPARDVARWANTLRHRDRSAGFESILTVPNWPREQPVERILTGLLAFQLSSDLDACFYMIFCSN